MYTIVTAYFLQSSPETTVISLKVLAGNASLETRWYGSVYLRRHKRATCNATENYNRLVNTVQSVHVWLTH